MASDDELWDALEEEQGGEAGNPRGWNCFDVFMGTQVVGNPEKNDQTFLVKGTTRLVKYFQSTKRARFG